MLLQLQIFFFRREGPLLEVAVDKKPEVLQDIIEYKSHVLLHLQFNRTGLLLQLMSG